MSAPHLHAPSAERWSSAQEKSRRGEEGANSREERWNCVPVSPQATFLINPPYIGPYLFRNLSQKMRAWCHWRTQRVVSSHSRAGPHFPVVLQPNHEYRRLIIWRYLLHSAQLQQMLRRMVLRMQPQQTRPGIKSMIDTYSPCGRSERSHPTFCPTQQPSLSWSGPCSACAEAALQRQPQALQVQDSVPRHLCSAGQ